MVPERRVALGVQVVREGQVAREQLAALEKLFVHERLVVDERLAVVGGLAAHKKAVVLVGMHSKRHLSKEWAYCLGALHQCLVLLEVLV